MADLSEKKVADTTVEPVDPLEKSTVVATRLVFGDEAFNQAMLKEPPIP